MRLSPPATRRSHGSAEGPPTPPGARESTDFWDTTLAGLIGPRGLRPGLRFDPSLPIWHDRQRGKPIHAGARGAGSGASSPESAQPAHALPLISEAPTASPGPESEAGSALSSRPIAWWKRLSVRFSALIAVVTLTVLGTFVLAAVRVQRDHLTHEVVRSAALFSDTIKSSTYHFMLENRRAEAYRIMETIGRQEGVERVRIFNKDGQITFSTDRAETGRLVDKRAESCYACHASDQPIVRLALSSRSRIYPHDGDRTLGMVTPIYNERSCSNASCHAHPESQRVLGVVDIGLSLAEVDAGMARLERRTLLLSLLALLGVAGLVGLVARRFVVKPVSQLLEGTREMAGGELEHEIPVRSGDEIGVLATSFNHMTRSLRQAREEIRRLMEGLERQVSCSI